MDVLKCHAALALTGQTAKTQRSINASPRDFPRNDASFDLTRPIGGQCHLHGLPISCFGIPRLTICKPGRISISDSGGSDSGDGGFVETSGKRYLEVTEAPDITAVNGEAGTWLLDPEDITISAASDSNITGASPFQPAAAGSSITNGVSNGSSASVAMAFSGFLER